MAGGSLAERRDTHQRPAWTSTRGAPLLNHFSRPHENRLRDCQSKRLRSLEVDDQLELRRLLHRKIGGLGTLEDSVRVVSRATVGLSKICAVRRESMKDPSLGRNPARPSFPRKRGAAERRTHVSRRLETLPGAAVRSAALQLRAAQE